MSANERVEAWLRFADEDAPWPVWRSPKEWNQACFHSQQSAEKALKAFLEACGSRPPKIHSIAELAELVAETGTPVTDDIRTAAFLLDRFYIPTRYPVALVGTLPDGLPERRHAEEAMRSATQILDWVKARIRLARP